MSDEHESKEEDLTDNIIFLHNKYPEINDIFNFNIKPLEEIKESCLFVLDTNILLAPYSIGSQDFGNIKDKYKYLIDEERLFIPDHVIKEYVNKRQTKISELFHQIYSRKKNKMTLGNYPIFEGSDDFKSLKELEKKINAEIDKFNAEIDNVTDLMYSWSWNDPINVVYSELFNDSLILKTTINIEEFQSEFSNRMKNKIPPGYKDTNKNENVAGDYIIWKAILDLGSGKKSDVVFVSDETKNDWFTKSSKMTIFPKFELIDEFRRKTNGKTFYIIEFSKFLKILDIEEETIQAVKTAEIEARNYGKTRRYRKYPTNFHGQAVKALGDFLRERHRSSEIIFFPSSRTFDLVVHRSDNSRLYFVIITDIHQGIDSLLSDLGERRKEKVFIVIIKNWFEEMKFGIAYIMKSIDKFNKRSHFDYSIIIGTLIENNSIFQENSP
ncbi:MAG: hypothetical protein HeimC3_47460 [Candidatus Heimdallarchaeota archaeon LC_3]|nr:MAG: hypothetical protein HeimC3_47460 [Candidatus Heimdallarchaeota archaeon LC_3]